MKTAIIWQPQTKPFDPAKGEVSEPNQQLEDVAQGLTVTEFLLQRLININPDYSVIASISEAPSWDAVAAKAAEVIGANKVVRGSDTNRLQNFVNIGLDYGFDTIVRITGDCMWHDAEVIQKMVAKLEDGGLDLVDNFRGENGYPEGFNLDVVSVDALNRFSGNEDYQGLLLPFDKLHVVVGLREFADEDHACIFGEEPFRVGYLDMEGRTYDVTKIPALYCANVNHLNKNREIYGKLVEKGIHPVLANIDQVLEACGTSLVPLDKAASLTTPASSRCGGTTEKLIAQNIADRYPLLRQQLRQIRLQQATPSLS